MQEVVDKFLIPHFLRKKMDASGEWRKNLEIIVGNNTAEIWGRYYTYWLVHGRGRNHDQSDESIMKFAKWAGSTFIKDWVENKGIAANPYAVAYKIARKGTKYKQQGGTDLIEILESKQVIDYINSQIGNYLRVEVELQIRRTAKEIFR